MGEIGPAVQHLARRPAVAAAGETLATELQAQGVPARFFPGRDLDLKADVVRVLTLHAAKGLEFPIVIVAGLDSGNWPVPEDFEEPDLFAERARHERRVLYVGLTRARDEVYMLYSGFVDTPRGRMHWGRSPFLDELDARMRAANM